jgi:hypothetical protein
MRCESGTDLRFPLGTVLAMAGKARRNGVTLRAEGNETRSTSSHATGSSEVKPTDAARAQAEADRDRFFATLEMHRSGASLRSRIEQGSCQQFETVRR